MQNPKGKGLACIHTGKRVDYKGDHQLSVTAKRPKENSPSNEALAINPNSNNERPRHKLSQAFMTHPTPNSLGSHLSLLKKIKSRTQTTRPVTLAHVSYQYRTKVGFKKLKIKVRTSSYILMRSTLYHNSNQYP